jgi:hypothetical protein
VKLVARGRRGTWGFSQAILPDQVGGDGRRILPAFLYLIMSSGDVHLDLHTDFP